MFEKRSSYRSNIYNNNKSRQIRYECLINIVWKVNLLAIKRFKWKSSDEVGDRRPSATKCNFCWDQAKHEASSGCKEACLLVYHLVYHRNHNLCSSNDYAWRSMASTMKHSAWNWDLAHPRWVRCLSQAPSKPLPSIISIGWHFWGLVQILFVVIHMVYQAKTQIPGHTVRETRFGG